MAGKHLKRGAHKIDNDSWWYEEPSGISMLKWIQCDDCGVKHCIISKISWRALRAALARKDK